MYATSQRAEQSLGQLNVSPVVVKAVKEELHRARNIALFLLAPFIGLAYAAAMPFVGLAMILMLAVKAFAKATNIQKYKAIGLLLASPFIGLMYVLSFPVVGAVMLIRQTYKSYKHQS